MAKSRIMLKDHPSLIYHQDISAICQPIFKQFGFCILNFIRLYPTGDVFYLCDNYAWIEHYLYQGYPLVGAFEQDAVFLNNDYVLWDRLNENDPIVNYSREMFNIKLGITIVRKFPYYTDFFNFGSPEDSLGVLHVFQQQRDKLYQFSELFYTKANHLIHKAQKQKFQLTDFTCVNHAITKQRLYLGPKYNYQYLTQKEIECLKSLCLGCNIPEIALQQNVSLRTLEKHIENIKQKLQCNTQFELGFIAGKLGIEQK